MNRHLHRYQLKFLSDRLIEQCLRHPDLSSELPEAPACRRAQRRTQQHTHDIAPSAIGPLLLSEPGPTDETPARFRTPDPPSQLPIQEEDSRSYLLPPIQSSAALEIRGLALTETVPPDSCFVASSSRSFACARLASAKLTSSSERSLF